MQSNLFPMGGQRESPPGRPPAGISCGCLVMQARNSDCLNVDCSVTALLGLEKGGYGATDGDLTLGLRRD